MPKKPNKDSDDNKARSNSETARRIWLAGIGAYGRAFTEAQEALKDVTGKSSEIFDELVQKGAMIEKVVEVKGKNMMDKTSVPSLDIDERIKAMRARLSRSAADNGADIEVRLDKLEAKLDKILELLEPKKPARKPSVKRAKTVRTKKPSPSKTSPFKTSPSKTSAAKK